MCTVSVIICTKNRPDDLMKCIDSLTVQTYPIHELVMIDSGDIELYDIINNYKNKLNINYVRYKTSLTVARNKGIDKSRGDIILFLDDDVILNDKYVHNIVDVFKTYGNDIGAVTGNIVNEQLDTKTLPNLIKYSIIRKIRNLLFKIFFLRIFGTGRFQPSGFPTHPGGKKEVLFIECLAGANMAFRKEVLDKFKFDENLRGYCFMEDCDISYRVAQEYKIVYTPYAELIHNVSKASRDADFLRMKMLIENHHYLFKKNFPQKAYNKFAFWVSMFGLFFVSFSGMQKDEFKGLCSGLKSIMIKSDKCR